jgi:hypothetical protein
LAAQRPQGAGPFPDGITIEAIHAQVDKILASETFAHSERLRRFLRFTVDQAVRGEHLKEHLVGVHVFDRDPLYDPRVDPIVRVEAGRLRSKLREYYETHGRDDPILVDFPKGSYAPAFAHQQTALPVKPSLARLPEGRTLAVFAALLVAVAASYWGASQAREAAVLRRQLEAGRRLPPDFVPIWGPFFSPESETFVVFGSPIFFAGGQDSGLFLRLSGLNEPAAIAADPGFLKLQERLGALSGPRYDYALMGDAVAVQRLTAFFGGAARRLTALPSHQAAWETIRDGNIIFLGAPRMIPLLQSLPVERDFAWDPRHNIVNRHPQPGEEATYSTPSHWDKMTYAVVACLPGLRPGRDVMLLTAHSAPGSLAAVDYLTRPDSARALAEKLRLSEPGGRRHFELLLRVFVDKGMPVKTEYLTHHLVRPG